MKLQNGYMLIYEKEVEGKRHLFASKRGIPMDDDVEIKYDSLTEDEVRAFKFIYEGDKGFKGAEGNVPAEGDKKFALTDGTHTILAEDGYEIVQSVAEQSATKKSKKKVVVEEEAPAAEVVAEEVAE